MRAVQRIAKNTGVFIIAQIISSVLTFFFFAYATRYLGPENFGVLSFALALTAIFGILNDLGLGQVVTREVARNKSLTSKYVRNVAVIRFFLSIITFSLNILTVNLIGYPEQTIRVVFILGLSMVCGAFSGLFYSVFQAHEKIEYISVGQILNGLLLFGGVFFVVNKRLDINAFALLYLIASMLVLMYCFIIFLWRFDRIKTKIDFNFCRSALKEALPFALVGIFTMILHWIDTIMLSAMRGDTVAGLYNAAYRLFFVLLFIPNALNAAIFPVMSYFHVSSKNDFKITFEKSFKYLTIIGIPMGIGGMLVADRIILMIFGEGYYQSIIAFQILIWSAVFVFMGTPFTNLLNSTNRQNKMVKIIGSSVILNIFLNLILIPKYSYIGAGMATVFSMLLIAIWLFLESIKTEYKIEFSKIKSIIIKSCASSFLMGLFIFYFRNINVFLLMGFSVIIYFTIMYIIKAFDKDDIDIFKKVLNLKKRINV